jgi:hypothetical protein
VVMSYGPQFATREQAIPRVVPHRLRISAKMPVCFG